MILLINTLGEVAAALPHRSSVLLLCLFRGVYALRQRKSFYFEDFTVMVMLLCDYIPRMKFVNGEIEVTVFAPCYIAHIVNVELLERFLVEVTIVLRVRITSDPRAEVDQDNDSIVEGKLHFEFTFVLSFVDS